MPAPERLPIPERLQRFRNVPERLTLPEFARETRAAHRTDPDAGAGAASLLGVLALACYALAGGSSPAALTAAVTAPALAFLALTLGVCRFLFPEGRP